MKRHIYPYRFLTLLLLLLALLWQRAWPAECSRPNIVLFMVDDMGWVDTSLPFGNNVALWNNVYHTPNMERLANRGMLFTDAYASPVCTPTRVSLITGMNAARHRVSNWTSIQKDLPSDHEDELLSRVDWNYNGFSPKQGVPHTITATALPELLRKAGYFTIHVGKAHWGAQGTPGANPINLGFVVNVAGGANGSPRSYLGNDNYGNTPEKFSYNAVQGLSEYYQSEVFLTDALTKEALKAVANPVENPQPFFLYLSHYAVHIPIQADKRFEKKYLDRELEPKVAAYASLIEGMDRSLGELMDFLDENDLTDNTVILFMSDNGGLSLAARGGEPHTQNAPLRSGKGSLYEGGIRVPMLVSWPGVVRPGTRSDYPVIIEDFFPSILEMAGLAGQRIFQIVDGVSFVPVLKGKTDVENRALIWHYPHRWIVGEGPGINYHSAIRKGAWKLIYNQKLETLELYDLSADIGEQSNLATVEHEVVRNLAIELTAFLQGRRSVMPLRKRDGNVIPWPSDLIYGEQL